MKSKTEPRQTTFRARLSPLTIAMVTLFAAAPLATARAQAAPESESSPAAAAPGASADSGAETAAAPEDAGEIVVTATRRKTTIQDIPLNVSAVTGETIAAQGLTDLADLTRATPGLYLVDQGGRDTNLLTVRGLNADSLTAGEFYAGEGGGVVAEYVGEIPLYVDFALLDIDRVEVLLGPQGTLYGAGTLGGAIRYIPNRPKFGETSLDVSTGGFLMSHSDNIGSESSVTLNVPLGETTALRATAGYWRDPGFIDSPYLVRVPGGSNPDPDFSDPADVAANLRNQDDVNRGDKVSARAAIRTQLWEKLDATLTGFYQNQRASGRSINHVDAFGTGRYENAERYTEPNNREDQLTTLEMKLDLGIAELTSATGYSQHAEDGRRDQTDLLLDFEYGYEDFPNFSAFTHEVVNEHRLNQELRLVSSGDTQWKWIVGGFYNRLHHNEITSEFVPGIPEFFGIDRPDNLEFWQLTKFHVNERAVFGELGYDFTDALNLTAGARYFKYKSRQAIGVALPLIDGSGPDEILPAGDTVSGSDDDVIFKVNTSYKFSRDLLTYFTFSQGYRIGGGNPVALCEDPLPDGQNVCALPSEREFGPDTTDNYEIGVHSKLFDGKLTLNGDVYYIDWKDAQIAGVTANGLIPITVNADKARSTGLELAMNAVLDAHWSGQLSYTYTDAELRSDAVGLLTTTKKNTPNTRLVDGQKGDRLPGSPKHMGNASVTWTNPLPEDLIFSATYGLVAQGDVLTKAGKRAKGEALGGYAVHFASASVDADVWTLRLYAENLFNKYAETGVRNDRTLIGNIFGDEDGDGVDDHSFRLRRYYHSVLTPMQVGLTFTYRFKF